MRAKLFCRTGKLKGKDFPFDAEATIGSGPRNTIVLSPSTISKSHARVFFDQERGRYVIEDLGSSNGTRLDGVPLLGREPLGALHVITFAEEHDFFFQAIPEDHSDVPEPKTGRVRKGGFVAPVLPPEAGEPDIAEAGPPGESQTVFERAAGFEVPAFQKEDGVEKTPTWTLSFEIDGRRGYSEIDSTGSVVGRSQECRVQIPHETVSRRHARLEVVGEGVRVTDLDSANGTYVDGEKIESANVQECEVTFGEVEARLERK